jgi:conjugative coupling factor TraD (TOL family)
MNMQKPLEALLRPPIEWMTTITSLLSAILLDKISGILLISPLSKNIIVYSLISFGILRFYQGFRVFKYQKNIRRMSHYAMTSKQLPISKAKLFLGKGFQWTTHHTQRLRDLDLDYNLHFKFASRFYQYIRTLENKWESHRFLKSIVTFLRKDHWLNPLRPYPKIGGEPSIHGVSENEENIYIDMIERASHLLVLGVPGVGKTRFAELLISQDIRRGDVVIVFDPKGDAELLKRIYIEAKNANRENDLLVFHLGFPELSCRYNPIGNFTRVTEVANRLSNQLPTSGESAAFKEFGWQFVNTIAMTLVALGEKPDYKKIKFYITKMDVLLEKYLEAWLKNIAPDLEEWISRETPNKKDGTKALTRLKQLIAYVEKHDLIHDPIFDDLHNASRYDKEYFSKITASLGPLLKKLTTGRIATLISMDYDPIADPRGSLDWLQVIRNKKIVYVGLDTLTDPVVGAAVGNAMFSDLVSVAGRLYKFGISDGFYRTPEELPLPPIRLYADEFNEIIGDEFIPLLNKGRGAGFTVTAFTQTWSDVESRLKSAAKAGQVEGNFGTVIMFRCKEAATVEMLLRQLPAVSILKVLPSSASQDSMSHDPGIYFSSSSDDRFSHQKERLIEQNDILNLPKGQAFALLEGGKLYKLRMPLPTPDNIEIESNIESIIKSMRDINVNKASGDTL